MTDKPSIVPYFSYVDAKAAMAFLAKVPSALSSCRLSMARMGG